MAEISLWRSAARRLCRNPMAVVGGCIVLILIGAAIFGPWISPYSYYENDYEHTNEGPSWSHWFGTDYLGRDQLTRVLYGARISLAVGVVASLISVVIGVTFGGIAGYVGGRTDAVMMRIVDIFYGIPLILFVILLMVVFQPGLKNIFLALGFTYWLAMARIVRGQVLSLKAQDFVMAERALGASHSRIIFRHIISNTLGPIIVTLTLSIPEAIFAESFLSYIGLGVSAPLASWGTLAADATSGIRAYPYLLFFPAAAISISMLAFNFLGDGLRDALDPRHIR